MKNKRTKKHHARTRKKSRTQAKGNIFSNTKKIKQISKYFIIFLLSSLIYIYSGDIATCAKNLCDISLKKIGFQIDVIEISNIKNSKTKNLENIIKQHSGIKINDNIFKLTANDIRNNIMKLAIVKDAIVRKNLPNIVSIEVTEKKPVAIWQKNTKLFLIDEDGVIIESINSVKIKMPIITGTDANINAHKILKLIDQSALKNDLNSMTFIKKRRWDIVVRGIPIKLPELPTEQTIKTIERFIKGSNIHKNSIKFIDLRTQGDAVVNGAHMNVNVKANASSGKVQ